MATKISIVVRTRSRGLFIRRALHSIQSQTFKDYEVILVNDGGSAEELSCILEGFAKLREKMSVVSHEISLGRWPAANAGARQAKGEYIVFHDDDDTWEKEYLAKSFSYLEEKRGSAFRGVSAFTYLIRENVENNLFYLVAKEDYNSWQKVISFNRMLTQISLHFGSFMFERKVFEEVGYFRDDISVIGDWEFIIRFMLHYEIGVIPEFLANYHLRAQGEGLSGNSVIADKSVHMATDQLIRNEQLRKSFKENPSLLGLLMNLNMVLGHNTTHLDYLSKQAVPTIMGEMRDLRKSVDSLKKFLEVRREI